MVIPDPVLKFLGTLYNFNPESYKRAAERVMTQEKTADQDDAEAND